MDDQQIIQLYWQRSQEAIAATAERYGAYCRAIARNILGSPEDTEECVNDAYLALWNAIPPQRPPVLRAFLGKIVRNLAFNRWDRDRAEKRGGGETALVLEELAECVSGGEEAGAALDRAELLAAVNDFLGRLPARKREMFLRRCWYCDSLSDIAARLGTTPANVSVTLGRVRRQLRQHLTERGFF